MKRHSLIIVLGIFIVLFAVVLTSGLWNAKGGLIDLIWGQLPSNPQQLTSTISQAGGKVTPYSVVVSVDTSNPVAQVAPEYLSFSIDASQVTGGKWWDPSASGQELGTGSVHAPIYNFNRPQLDVLVNGLTPAYLRIGGSESDKVFYDLQPAAGSPRPPPAGYQSVLTVEEWDALNGFAQRHNLKLVFTLNAGPSSRDSILQWDSTNTADLLRYTTQKGYPVSVWELGNEVNNFWFVFGPKNQISTTQYHQDLLKASSVVNQLSPSARLGGEGSMFWPVLGEPLSLFYGFMPGYLAQSGDLVDQVSWHYYPQQSRRGPVATRRAYPSRMLDPVNLDEAGYWADKMRVWRDHYAPGKPLWLGETGNAQFGGEPGLSDVYLADLWWLDELGLMAEKGTEVVVRQTLSGSNYGLIDDTTLAPRPDYWASLLWKQLMGQKVYNAKVTGPNNNHLRAYAQAGSDGTLCVLLINLDPVQNAVVNLPVLSQKPYTVYNLTAPDLFGQVIQLNGIPLKLTASGKLPELEGKSIPSNKNPSIEIHPLSYSFISVNLK